MDQETANAIGFMIFGLAFFILITVVILRAHTQDENRRIMELREFGIGSKRQRKGSMFRHK